MRFAGVVLLLVLAGVGCRRDDKSAGDGKLSPKTIASAASSMAAPQVTGSMHSVGGSLGTWDLTLDDCQSGDYKGFFGVDLFPKGTNHMRLRYVHDEAAGEIMKVAYPNKLDEAVVFDKDAKCTVREGQVEKTTESTRVTGRGNVPHLKGHLKLDCPDDGGKGRVYADVTFAHCH